MFYLGGVAPADGLCDEQHKPGACAACYFSWLFAEFRGRWTRSLLPAHAAAAPDGAAQSLQCPPSLLRQSSAFEKEGRSRGPCIYLAYGRSTCPELASRVGTEDSPGP
jgi:hypothetical protein